MSRTVIELNVKDMLALLQGNEVSVDGSETPMVVSPSKDAAFTNWFRESSYAYGIANDISGVFTEPQNDDYRDIKFRRKQKGFEPRYFKSKIGSDVFRKRRTIPACSNPGSMG